MKRYGWTIAAVVVVLLISLTTSVCRFYTDWLWFIEVNYRQVFLRTLITRIELGFVFGAIVFVVLGAVILVADALSRVGFLKIEGDAIELPGQEQLATRIRLSMFLVAAFLAFVMGIGVSSQWATWLRFTHAAPFGVRDPVFGRDISFFIFKLPLLNFFYQWLFSILIIAFIMAGFIFVVKRGILLTSKGPLFKSGPLGLASVLIALMVALKAAGYRLAMYNLLVGRRDFVFGAGYTDAHFRIPLFSALAVVAALAAVALLVNAAIRSWKFGAAALGLVVAASVVGSVVSPVYQRLRVQPNEITMERPYIERQIQSTRAAFNLDHVAVRPFPAYDTLTPAQLRKNLLTIKNIRLWDALPLLSTYRQLQEIRPYYNFTDVDTDRYNIGGQYTQVNIAARELAYDKLPSRIWINEHLVYTHGFGVVSSPVTHTSLEGMPNFLIKDIPPTTHTDLKLLRPEIYYGKLSNEYVFADTDLKEFDYPVGDSNRFTHYAGTGGVRVKNFIRRVAFAIRFSSLAILLNTDIRPDSRVLFFRPIIDRAQRILPFITIDGDPYPVVVNGRVFWILDGYTVSDYYPYSETFNDINYVRNSVKVVIDAYNGTTDFYMADPSDPVVRTWASAFPGVFQPLDRMPEALRHHLRYPMDYFKVQSRVFRTYHMTDPQVFYNKEDQWAIPNEIFYREAQELEPYYAIMKLPGESGEEYALVFPFTPYNRDNLASLMCARMDGKHYGELVIYSFPKKKLIYGPFQIEARIDQDTDISRQFSLWNQRGSQIIRGNLLVVPIDDSLMYVEPVYLMAEKGQIPELKRVIVSVGDQVVMENTLADALRRVAGGDVGLESPVPLAPQTAAPGSAVSAEPSVVIATGTANVPIEKLRRAAAAMRAAQEASKQGDWIAFGRAMKQLQDVLGEIDRGR